MSSSDLISIVITTYNRSDALVAVLHGFTAQDDTNFELVIADDGSVAQHRDAIARAVSKLGLRVKHVWHPDVGFTAARVRNLGVLASSGDYILFLDGDCVPEVDFVRRHRQLREAGCFVNGSRVLMNPTISAAILAGQETIYGRNFAYWLNLWRKGQANKYTARVRWPDLRMRKRARFLWKGIRSCNLGLWRSDYEAVDGFDETFVGWGHEDADLVLRLHHAGLVRKNGFFATEVYHLWHPESSQDAASDNAQRVRNRIHSGQIKADRGLEACRLDGQVELSSWGN